MSGSLRAVALGHPDVRATHAKTIELAREDEIGTRATCVVAVGARLDEAAVGALRGRVEVAIACGGRTDAVRGLLNPAYHPGDPLVVRRARAVTRDALVVDADRGAAELDRALVRELAQPGAAVEVTLREAGGDAPGVLVVHPGAEWGADWGAGASADAVFASPLGAGDVDAVVSSLDDGSRVALRAALASDPLAVALVAGAHDRGHVVLPADGLAPLGAALAVAGVAVTPLAITAGRPAPPAAGATRVMLDVPADRAERWLAGADRALVALDVGTPREEFVPWRAGAPLEVDGAERRTATVVVAAAAAPPPSAGLDPAVARLARALLERGASTRDVARAVHEATGLPRREAYDAVVALTSNVARDEPRTSR